ncbi:MAG TPA: type II toxin-antitoxin system VapC family toxin [Candidatus Bathyarchaeia archaeon]|nr:type II toxin-antitoxin system VapC family toxin [Candidatus Bathyarchaeia archaeon]
MILLDTHALIWFASEPAKLSENARRSIITAYQAGGIGVSAISLWEIAWLATHGRVAFTGTAESFVERISSHTSIRPITPRIALLANQFPDSYSSDPCDRIIGATALAEGIPLVTKDRNIRAYRGLKTIW